MNSYAIYRLPHQEYCVVMKQLGGDAVRLSSYDELSGKKLHTKSIRQAFTTQYITFQFFYIHVIFVLLLQR